MNKCQRKGCAEEVQAGSDLCKKHTRKYYGANKSRYLPKAGDFGCGGGQRSPKLLGEGLYGKDRRLAENTDFE